MNPSLDMLQHSCTSHRLIPHTFAVVAVHCDLTTQEPVNEQLRLLHGSKLVRQRRCPNNVRAHTCFRSLLDWFVGGSRYDVFLIVSEYASIPRHRWSCWCFRFSWSTGAARATHNRATCRRHTISKHRASPGPAANSCPNSSHNRAITSDR